MRIVRSTNSNSFDRMNVKYFINFYEFLLLFFYEKFPKNFDIFACVLFCECESDRCRSICLINIGSKKCWANFFLYSIRILKRIQERIRFFNSWYNEKSANEARSREFIRLYTARASDLTRC